MSNPVLLAMTTGETVVAVAVIVAVSALVLLVVWQMFVLARRNMELRAVREAAPPDANEANTST